MDTLSVKSQTMKNQLGAAFGELLISITPILLRFIEIVRTAANVIAQFFAALGGRGSYLKAVDATADMNKNLGGAGKAAKELRRQLMGFDEINRLDAPDSGGGGGGSAVSDAWNNMFQEAEVPDWMQNLGKRIKELLPILKTISAVIAGISLLRHVGEVLKWGEAFDGVMAKILGVALAIAGAVLLWDGFSDALNNGVDWGNLGEMIAGTTLLVVGLGTAFGATGAIIGLLIAGFALCAAGINEWKKTGEASLPVLTAITVGILAIGAALALATGSWIPAVIAAILAAVMWVVEKWDYVKERWNAMWSGILSSLISYINACIDWIRPLLQMIDRVVWFFGGSSNLGGFSVSMPAGYATGGFPEDGMFMANHSELVGQFSNGHTAVANNEQIISGIERGVYNAMTSVLANQNNSNRDIRVYLDGKEIGAASRKYERNMNRATGVALA